MPRRSPPCRHLGHVLRHGGVMLALACFAASLLAGCGGKTSADGEVITVRVVDEQGRPASWARVLYAGGGGESRGVVMRWDAERSVVTLPRASAPHALQVAGPGRKTQVLEDVRTDQTVRLELGYPVEIHVVGSAPRPEPPRLILFRIRPVTEQDPARDPDAALRVSDVCSLIFPRAGATDESLPLLPTRGWGFAAAQTDAAAGLLLPEPGRYEVRWGLFDTDEGTWQGAAGAAYVLEVEEHGREAQRLDVVIEADALQTVRRALRAQLDALHAQDAAREAAPDAERSDADPSDADPSDANPSDADR